MAVETMEREVDVLEDDITWLDRARCRDTDPDRFFVRGAAQARAAIRMCQGCPVQERCLRYALEHDIDFGVWGGLTERQRRALKRRQYAQRALSSTRPGHR